MDSIRLRHPKGVSTLQLSPVNDDYTVQAFQLQIHTMSNILPSRQVVKTGYPPKPLTMDPALPFSSLGIKPGDQIIVSEAPGSESVEGATRDRSVPLSFNPTRSKPLVENTPSMPPSNSSGPDFVDTVDGSVLVHRVVLDDNSCLFSAAALIFEQSTGKAGEMRKIVADGIRNDAETYSDAILGMPPSQYIQTILKPTTWGGAIELGILAKHYGVEIASIDVETGRIDHFPPPENTGTRMRCLMIYTGIHYDAASLAPSADAPSEWHQTLFPIAASEDGPDPIIVAAKKLADCLRAKKAYTNTNTFDLKCEQCGKGLKGEKEARAHAEQTGHTHFGEY